METKNRNNFKAVDFMRQVRNELSDLYHTDKDQYHNELEKAMEDFLAKRAKSANNIAMKQSGRMG